MTYLVVENFAAGVDRRKHPATAPVGTLRDAVNCHLTEGGEIEKRKAFIEAFDAGADTYGIAGSGTELYTFGTVATPVGYPLTFGSMTLNYVQLTLPIGKTISHILDWDLYDGKVYVSVAHTDGSYSHHYDGVLVPNGAGRYIRTYQSKMYGVEGRFIYFSVVGDPTDWTTTASGAGSINVSTNDAEADDLIGLEAYYNQLAVFSRRAIQLWAMDTDPANNQQVQVVRDIGTLAAASPRQYGSGDVLFLSSTGVRSLQARDSSNAGSVSDIGSPIDPIMQALRITQGETAYSKARTVLEPDTGRFWVAFNDQIWVLSAFPGPKVTAWSEYTPETAAAAFTIDSLASANGYVFVRDTANKIYLYGGLNRNSYDAVQAQFQTPYMMMDRPAHFKKLKGFDSALDGSWLCEISMDPNNVAWETFATLTETTYPKGMVPVQGFGSHYSIRMTTTSASAARVANIALHYNLSEDN